MTEEANKTINLLHRQTRSIKENWDGTKRMFDLRVLDCSSIKINELVLGQTGKVRKPTKKQKNVKI